MVSRGRLMPSMVPFSVSQVTRMMVSVLPLLVSRPQTRKVYTPSFRPAATGGSSPMLSSPGCSVPPVSTGAGGRSGGRM